MINRSECEYLRTQAKEKFDLIKPVWADVGSWVLPHRTRYILGQQDGQRVNRHIVDGTHILALRSYVAGFLEGNTSATRPWYRTGHADPDRNMIPENKEWLDKFTRRTLITLTNSNFYHAAGIFYYDYGTFNTSAHYIEETPNGLHFHTLLPGSYYCLNNHFGVADVLIRDFSLTVKALVDEYGVKKNGKYDWSNFSTYIKDCYENGNYTIKVNVIQIIKQNKDFDPSKPTGGKNRQWVLIAYENGVAHNNVTNYNGTYNYEESSSKDKYLRISYSKRKPFIVGRSDSSDNFEFGEKGPSTDALGIIKSLNKKAIGKDKALEKMLEPTIQGPASLKKSYVTNAPNKFVPLDANQMAQGGLKSIHEVNPAVAALNQDVSDLRQQVDKMYYADFLLFLSMNPKTRTATETNAIINEQQMVIGPNLQSLNQTYNTPVVEFVMDYVLDTDPHLPPPPEDLAGEFLRIDFISVFAQAQKAADLPSIDRYIQMVSNVGQLNPKIWDKVNLDKLADLYEDRLYLPAGLNNPQSKVDAMREQAQAQAQRQQAINEMIPNLAGAAKDLGMQQKPQGV
jgi:hypothetical protein